jgi:hypothetical protein
MHTGGGRRRPNGYRLLGVRTRPPSGYGRPAVLAALLLLAVAAPAVASSVPRRQGNVNADPKLLVLQPVDLPGSFERDDGHYVTNAQLDATSSIPKDYHRLGRLTGYYASYSTIAIGGLTAVSTFASIYKLGDGAHASLAQSIAGTQGMRVVRAPRAALASLGPDVRVFLQKQTQNGRQVDFYTVAWRNGAVFAEVMGAGVAGTIDPLDVVALAKKQDRRIDKLFS